MHGGKYPWWVPVLIAAQEWGTEPWKIAGGGKLTWYFRWLFYRNQSMKAQQVRSKQGI